MLLVWIALSISLAAAGVIPNDANSGTTTNIQGPSSSSRIQGPDGSVITAESPGGQIIHQEQPGVFAPAGHFVGPTAPLLNPVAPGMAAHQAVDAVLSGPAGAIAAGRYATDKAQDGTQSAIGSFGVSNSYNRAAGVQGQTDVA